MFGIAYLIYQLDARKNIVPDKSGFYNMQIKRYALASVIAIWDEIVNNYVDGKLFQALQTHSAFIGGIRQAIAHCLIS